MIKGLYDAMQTTLEEKFQQHLEFNVVNIFLYEEFDGEEYQETFAVEVVSVGEEQRIEFFIMMDFDNGQYVTRNEEFEVIERFEDFDGLMVRLMEKEQEVIEELKK